MQAIGDLRHDRLVGFAGGCSMQTWGDATTCIDFDEDNDGLWTSVCAALSLMENLVLFIVACRYTAGLAYKYAVTQDEDDRQRALHRFYAIAFLHNVTGIKGELQPGVGAVLAVHLRPCACRTGRSVVLEAKHASPLWQVVQQHHLSGIHMERSAARTPASPSPASSRCRRRR